MNRILSIFTLSLGILAPNLPSAHAASAGEPRMILPKLHMVNITEIDAGDIAFQKACNQEVKDLAQLISNDHKALEEGAQTAARFFAISLDNVPMNSYEKSNFRKQTKDVEKLRAMEGCVDIAFLKSMRDGHIFSAKLVNSAMRSANHERIQKVLQDTKATIPVHYDGSVRLLKMLDKDSGSDNDDY